MIVADISDTLVGVAPVIIFVAVAALIVGVVSRVLFPPHSRRQR